MAAGARPSTCPNSDGHPSGPPPANERTGVERPASLREIAMRECLKFYIDGQWVAPAGTGIHTVVDPTTEAPSGRVAMGNEVDVDRAVQAARRAFDAYAATSREERIALLERVAARFEARKPDLCEAVVAELGCPTWLAEQAQVPLPGTHIQ